MTAGIILGGDTYPHCIVEDLKAERQQSIDVCVPTGAPAPTIADDETDTETINTSPRR